MFDTTLDGSVLEQSCYPLIRVTFIFFESQYGVPITIYELSTKVVYDIIPSYPYSIALKIFINSSLMIMVHHRVIHSSDHGKKILEGTLYMECLWIICVTKFTFEGTKVSRRYLKVEIFYLISYLRTFVPSYDIP